MLPPGNAGTTRHLRGRRSRCARLARSPAGPAARGFVFLIMLTAAGRSPDKACPSIRLP